VSNIYKFDTFQHFKDGVLKRWRKSFEYF